MSEAEFATVDAVKAQGMAAMEEESVDGPYPLALAQESLWFVEQMVPGTPVYHLAEAWEIKGRINVNALQQSLDQIVQRHEVLRTIFKARDGKPEQRIIESARIELKVLDIAPGQDARPRLDRRLKAEATQTFDLGCAPLGRATLFRINSHDQVLLLNLHHIISDAWSQDLFMRELVTCYSAFARNEPCQLAPPAIQYADFALWQREMLASEAGKQHLEYWKEKFRTPSKQLLLCSDHPRRGVPSYRGCTEFRRLSMELVHDLKALSRREGVTLYMTLLAAFKTLLHRFTEEVDIVIGSPMACRERVEVDGLLGFFVNTHALRTDLTGDPSFPELLKRVRETVLDANAHQEIPGELVLKSLPWARSSGHHGLFQVVFGWQTDSPSHWNLPGFEASRIEVDTGTSKFDWTVLVKEDPEGLSLRSEFSTDLFEAATIRSLLDQFQVLLEGIAKSPATRISLLPLLTREDQSRVIVEWNRTASDYERQNTIHEIFEAQAERTPQRVALIFEGESLSYSELNGRANQLAKRLRSCGVDPSARVGLCLPRCAKTIVGMLGILKAGGAYVPLDLEYPAERLRYLIRDSGVGVVVAETHSFARLQACGYTGRIIALDLEECNPPAEETADAEPTTSAASPAYVMYTSGSTGTPKGVVVPHRAVVRLVRQSNYMDFSAEQVFLHAAPISFDASTFEIWGALLNGARLVILPSHSGSLEQLGRAIRENHVTTLWLTTGLFDQMIQAQLDALRGLKYLLTGGDVLSPARVSQAVRELPGCQVINGYGPTENTTFSCCYTIPKVWPADQPVPIGRPIANTTAYVLDRQQSAVPIGVPGELYVGGDGLALGYLNQPQLTAEKFVPNRFEPDKSPLLYRTGDRARWLPDGNLEFLGRIDEQVKIRGYRVEPREVESALIEHPLVKRAVVVTRNHEFLGKQLIAYVLARSDRKESPSQITEFLQSKLPAYMVPAKVVVVDALPLTANGKFDRHALPEPDFGQSKTNTVAPRTATEELVAKIWSEVLGCDGVSVDANFFYLGGHSLLATQVVSRISKSVGVELPVAAIFQAPTVAGLACIVDSADQNRLRAESDVIRRTGPDRAHKLLGRLDELTETEIEELLQDPELKA